MRRPPPGGSEAVILSREQDGETLALKKGGEVLLSLPENPTTGYRWTFVADGLDIAGDTYAGQAEPSAGGGGTRTVRLVATRTGAARLSATLQRSWESPGQAVGRCAIQFNVS
jgi:inhibitor of cysteine peptidase